MLGEPPEFIATEKNVRCEKFPLNNQYFGHNRKLIKGLGSERDSTRYSSSSLPKKRRALESESVTLSCQANGLPMPRVTWTGPGGSPLAIGSDKYEQRTLGDLIVHSLSAPGDEGEYRCEAANVYGQVHTVTRLEVIRRAKKEEEGKRREVSRGYC